MNTLQTNPLAEKVTFSKSDFTVYLKDGRALTVPLAWFALLANASMDNLKNYEILGDGEGIHWSTLDEDISVSGLLTGQSLQAAS